MADPLNRTIPFPDVRVDDYDEGDDDATEASQRSLLNSLGSSSCAGGTIRMEGWLNHITSSYKNNSNASSTTAAASSSSATATAAASSTPSSSATSKLSKTVTKKTMNKRQRYFVLRGSTLSYYSRKHDVKAKGTFVLTRGCTVGPVVYSSLEDVPNSTTTMSAATTADAASASKSKKKSRQFYCVQVSWPINNKPSRDEKVIAQVKAQVAAESENEALQQKLLKLQQLELQEMLPLVDENGSVAGGAAGSGSGGNTTLEGGGKSPMIWPKQMLRRVKSDNTGSPPNRDGKLFQDRSLQFLPVGEEVNGGGDDQQEYQDRCRGEQQLYPTQLFASSMPFQSPECLKSSTATTITANTNNSLHRRNITELPPPPPPSKQHPDSAAIKHNHLSPTTSHDHELGPHKHYKTQIEKQTRHQQKSAEELQKVMHLLSQKESHQKTRKRVIQGTKVAAFSTAALTAGILTAGVGVAAGLVFVGVTAAAGGSGAVVGSKVLDRARGKYFQHQSQKSFHLIIGAATYEEAMQWKKAMEAVIKELVDESNEQAGEMGEEWKIKKVLSGGEQNGDAVVGTDAAHLRISNGTNGRSDINNVRENVMHDDMAPKWVPIQGGGMALWGILGALGGGGGSLRIFREELPGGGESSYNPYSLYSAPWLFSPPPNSPFPTIPRFRSDVGLAGHPFPPFKASVTLKSNSLDAFMCLMCNGRITNDEFINYNGGSGRIPMPNSGQIASFRIIETIDDHTDVIHLVFRPLYLFPSWTAPRDFVMYRFWKYDDDGTYQICLDSDQHRDCPPVTGYVRGDMHSVYTIAPLKWKKSVSTSASHASRPNLMNEECLLSHVVQVDPRGWVPSTSSIPFFRNQGYGDAFAIMALHQMLDVKETLDKIRFVSVPIDGAQSNASGGSHRGRSRLKLSTKRPDNRLIVTGVGRGVSRATTKLERSHSDLLASGDTSGHREQNIFVPTLYRADSADITDDDADYDFRNEYPEPPLSTINNLNVGIESSSSKDNTPLMSPIRCIPPPTR